MWILSQDMKHMRYVQIRIFERVFHPAVVCHADRFAQMVNGVLMRNLIADVHKVPECNAAR